MTSFLPVLQNGFLEIWDDGPTLLENFDYRGLHWEQLHWMFTTFLYGHYQPLSWVTLGLDYLIWGMDPFGYHLTNLILHSLNAVLVYCIAVRLLSSGLSLFAADFILQIGAGLAAALFAIHPLRVESVAWATERRDLLSAFFFLLTILCYLRVARAKEEGGYAKWLIVTLVVYCFSLLSKAVGMVLPVILLVLDIYPLTRLGTVKKRWLGHSARKIWLEKLPFLVLAVSTARLAIAAQYDAGAIADLSYWGWFARFSQVFYSLAFYIWKILVPTALSPLYELREPFIPWDWPYLTSVAVVVGITLITFMMRSRYSAGLAIWVCYAALILPVSGIAQSGPQLVADRYSYLACIGWAVLAGGGFVRFSYRGADATRFVSACAAALLIVIGLGILTWQQTKIWHDSESLFRRVLAVEPRSRVAHSNLGHVLLARGEVDEAITHFRQSLQIGPTFLMAHFGLAVALSRQQKFAEAIDEYQKTLAIYPAFPQAHDDLGGILAGRGRLEEAMEHFRIAIRLNPALAIAHFHLGDALLSRDQPDEAIHEFKEALRLQPGLAEARRAVERATAKKERAQASVQHE